jgi:hypothetical protein
MQEFELDNSSSIWFTKHENVLIDKWKPRKATLEMSTSYILNLTFSITFWWLKICSFCLWSLRIQERLPHTGKTFWNNNRLEKHTSIIFFSTQCLQRFILVGICEAHFSYREREFGSSFQPHIEQLFFNFLCGVLLNPSNKKAHSAKQIGKKNKRLEKLTQSKLMEFNIKSLIQSLF